MICKIYIVYAKYGMYDTALAQHVFCWVDLYDAALAQHLTKYKMTQYNYLDYSRWKYNRSSFVSHLDSIVVWNLIRFTAPHREKKPLVEQRAWA